MGFKTPSSALDWLVGQFKSVRAQSIYSCGGPCCNGFVWLFIKSIEYIYSEDINERAVDEFDSMATCEKDCLLESYAWFLVSCGDDDGRKKFDALQNSLRHTPYFQEKLAAEEKAARLKPFSAREATCSQKIRELEKEILRISSEIQALHNQIINIRNAKEREGHLIDFERMTSKEQFELLMREEKPLAFYEGRLGNLLAELDSDLLSQDSIDKLLRASKYAKPSSLPQVANLHRQLKARSSRSED
jgi:hypothetical protein